MQSIPYSYFVPYQIAIRDINYGHHVGGDSIVHIIHQARLSYLGSLGSFSEKNVGNNTGLIMASLEIQFKKQLLYQDKIRIYMGTSQIKKTNFTLSYTIIKEDDTISHTCQTTMAFFDYSTQKICVGPELFMEKLKLETPSL